MSKNFLYQINFNREKYPEICAELEAAKKRTGGIAWYLRKLIEKDIQMKKGLGCTESVTPVQKEPKEKPKTSITEEEEEEFLPDNNGGFL